MGVDYSTTIAWGLMADDKTIPPGLDPGWADDPDVEKWLEENGYPEIGFTRAGDFMGGEPMVNIYYLKGENNVLSVDRYESIGPVDLDPVAMTAEQYSQFIRLMETLDIMGSHLGWKVVFNVS